MSGHRECKCNCVQLFQVGSHLQNWMVCKCTLYREQDSPGSVGGCGCGSVEGGVPTHGTAAVEGGREGGREGETEHEISIYTKHAKLQNQIIAEHLSTRQLHVISHPRVCMYVSITLKNAILHNG